MATKYVESHPQWDDENAFYKRKKSQISWAFAQEGISTRVMSLFVYHVSSIYLELEWSYVA